jgi:hypothetical protein
MIEEQNKDNPPSTDDSPQQNAQLNTPSTDETIATSAETSTEAEQPSTLNPQPSTVEDMEVHHHTHHEHGKRNWRSYFWEFLMLFLAVFCGFLAEYQLEHTIEHQREKEYAQALYDELLADSISYSDKLGFRTEKIEDCDYLAAYIKDSSMIDLPRAFYPAFTNVFYLINSYTFEPKDGVLSQLKGSGSLRYFKSPDLQKLFGDLSVAINNVRYRNDQEYQFFANPLKPFLLKHYDFSWIDELRKRKPQAYTINLIREYRKSNDLIKAKILNANALDRQEVVNMILFHKTMVISSRTLQLNDYIKTNQKILEVLRKNYSLKNE